MATFSEKVTLDEAFRMSKCISNISFRWIMFENILKAAPPSKNYSFVNTEVFWCYTNKKFKISAIFTYRKTTMSYSADYDFPSLDALREAYPELFEIKGIFRVIH